MDEQVKREFFRIEKQDGILNAYNWLIEQGVELESPESVALEIVERHADHYGWTEIASKCRLDLPVALRDKVEEIIPLA